jgi:hypothetical protein
MGDKDAGWRGSEALQPMFCQTAENDGERGMALYGGVKNGD